MKLKLLSLAVAAAVSLPHTALAASGDGPQVYGQVDVGLQRVEEGDNDIFELDDKESRVGVKGVEDLGGFEGLYQFEFGVDTSDGSGIFKSRNSFVGLGGDFGTITAGQFDTPFKKAQGDIDLFSDQLDMKSYVAGEEREKNIIQYQTNEIAGMSASLAFQPGEQRTDNENDVEDGIADAFSVAAMFENELLYAAIAYDMNVDYGYWGDNVDDGFTLDLNAGLIDDPNTTSEDESETTFALNKSDALRLTGIFKFDTFGFGALVQQAELSDVANPLEQTALVLSAYAQMDQTKFEFQLGQSKVEQDNNSINFDTKFAGVGVEQQLSERTNVYAIAARENNDNGTVEVDTDVLLVGAKHKF